MGGGGFHQFLLSLQHKYFIIHYKSNLIKISFLIQNYMFVFFSSIFGGGSSGGYLSYPNAARPAPGNLGDAVSEFRRMQSIISDLNREECYGRSWLQDYEENMTQNFLSQANRIIDFKPDRTGTDKPTCRGGDICKLLSIGNRPLFLAGSPFYDESGYFYRPFYLFPYRDSDNAPMNGQLILFFNPDERHVLVDRQRKIWIDYRTLTISRLG